ncbi:DUF2793 domain-containing protein [Rhodoplanes serenus]|uniref:DUF2793 domain-containing protein n=1 Tax=Rhodoplanes serenus TaxID=200615 RepID=UPI000DAEB4EB|nr:DUF2793 domain-containing protein [Rhodoplanes serenus]RAI31962.1 hypothetical protein CH340_17025 [Rhodoplanes serenus]
MTDTPHLGLPTLAAAQAQKHVTHNEALHRLDALVMLAVADRDFASPPGAPAEGDRYLVPAAAAGGFAGRAGQIAHYVDGGWDFYAPRPGWLCWVADEGVLLAWTGAVWRPVVETGLTGAALQNLGRVGIGTSADAANPLAVKADGVLLSHNDVTPGSGHIRIAVNKAAPGRDAAFVFQDSWSARALFGLLGEDDFTIKVSPDGSAFKTAVVVDKDDGAVHHSEGSKFSAYLNFGQDYAAGAWRDLLFNNFRHNDQADAALAANVLTFTAPTAGYYLFGLSATYEAGSGPTKMQVGIAVGAAQPTPDTIGTTGDATVVSGETQCRATALLKLAAGDTVRPKIFFTGANGRVLANENTFWGVRIA